MASCFYLLRLPKLQASDIMGADMTYRCLGGDSFEFTTVVYKDCKANWSIPANTYNLLVSANNNCTFSGFTANPVLIACQDITPICGNSCTQCMSSCNASTSNSGCTFPYGIEKLTFRKVIYLGGTSCCSFNIGYIGNSTRNYATTTCCNADIFYANVTLNRCVTPCNSSPVFTNDPVGIICANQDFAFNNGAMDTIDGDSLSFELTPALSSAGTSATYYGAFTYLRPISFLGFPNTALSHPAGFRVDPTTGDMDFRPTVANQISVIVIKIKEWRMVNGVMTVISENRRDMQFIVVACPNNKVPKIRPDYVKEACAGQQVCMSIESEDDDLNDTVVISWNNGIPGATFTNNNGTVKKASGQVCWTPGEEHISNLPYVFTIKAKDNACPLSGQTIKAFKIFVRESPKATLSVNVLNCGKVALDFTPFKIYPALSKDWSIKKGNQVVWSSRNQKDTAVLQPGSYRVSLTLATTTPCLNIISDSIVIPDYVKVVLPPDTSICAGSGINITSTTSSGNAPYDYAWFQVVPQDTNTSPVALSTSSNFFVVPDSQTRYALQVKDGNGCYNADTIRVTPKSPPALQLGADQRICSGSSLVLDAGTTNVTLKYLWSTGDTTRKLTVTDSNTYIVRITDTIGCINKDTVHIFVNNVKPEAGFNFTVCENSTVNLVATGADTYQWYNLAGFTTNPLPTPLDSDSAFSPTITQSMQYIVRGSRTYMSVSCSGYDTVRVNMNPLPQISLGTGGPLCENANAVSLFPLINYPTLTNGTWRSAVNPLIITNNFFDPRIAGPNPTGNGHVIFYKVTDNLGCSNEKSTFFKVAPIPVVTSLDTFSVCGDVAEINLKPTLQRTPTNTSDGVVDWYSVNNNPLVNANLVKTDNQNIRFKTGSLTPNTYCLVYRYTSNIGGCSNTDTSCVRVKPVPATNAGTVPPVCWNGSVVSLTTAANPSPSGGVWTSPDITLLPGYIYNPSSIGAGGKFTNTSVWFKYTVNADGCIKADSVQGVIRGIPNIQMSNFGGVCIDTAFDLQSLATPNSPTGTWSGPGVSGSSFSATTAGAGTHQLKYAYTNPVTGCSNADSFNYVIQPKPAITFTAPRGSCAGSSFPLSALLNNATGITWSRVGDGGFGSAGGPSTTTQLNTTYFPGAGDVSGQGFRIQAITQSGMAYCPQASIDVNIPIFPIPTVSISGQPTEACSPLTVNFTATTNAAPGAYLIWDFGNTVTLEGEDNVRTASQTYTTGSYVVNLRIYSDSAFGFCRNDAAPITVTAYPTPDAAMAASRWKTTVALPDIQFTDKSVIGGGGRIHAWLWTFGDRNNSTSPVQNPLFSYPISDPGDTGTFQVTLWVEADKFQCWDTTNGYIYIQPDITVFIPNAFTPNKYNHERNNRFYVVADGFETIDINIYSRWGEHLYHSTDINEGWDGKYKGVEAQPDVYVYVVRVVAVGGKQYEYYGTITLLR